jgi:peptide/nickel transport system substrate-binding protein
MDHPVNAARCSRRSLCALLATAASARALGRIPLGGALRLRVPLRTTLLDPQLADDPFSALFGAAIADPLYALDAGGKPYPALADALPEATAGGALVRLRPELVSARGKPLLARDAIFALKRARSLGGAALLAPFAAPLEVASDPLAFSVPGAEPTALARALSSPLCALVPRGFSPLAPDGTGGFQATLTANLALLARNPRAARGAAFLDRIEIAPALDLAECLRAFEAGQADLGWLGNGLYRPRAGALSFEGPSYGWLTLRTGLDAKNWGAPGVAQQLCDGVQSQGLAHFGLRALPGAGDPVSFAGSSLPLLVADDTPYLVELARALEPLLGPGTSRTPTTPTPRSALAEARRSRRFGFMLDFVRSASSDAALAPLTLLAAVDPALAVHPPLRAPSSVRDLTRSLPLGVLGELAISGARLPDYEALPTWQLPAVWRRPP